VLEYIIMKMYGGVEVRLHKFLILPIVVVCGQHHMPGILLRPGKRWALLGIETWSSEL
jgi:hypothetical protein